MKHLESYIHAFIGAWLTAEGIAGVEPLIIVFGTAMVIYAQYEYKYKEK